MIAEYIATMERNGFPPYHFKNLGNTSVHGRDIKTNLSTVTLIPLTKDYLSSNKIDLTTFTYDDVDNMALDFVWSTIKPQYFNEDNEGGWYDETYDIWRDVFVYLVEKACLQLFYEDYDAFMNKVYNLIH